MASMTHSKVVFLKDVQQMPIHPLLLGEMRAVLQYVLLLIFICLSCLKADGQIQVTNAAPFNDPDHLVQNVLLGPGVPYIPTFPAPPTSVQIGKFTNGNSFGFGLDSGIVLISGNATDAMPNQPFSTGFGATPDIDLENMLTAINSSSIVVNDGVFVEFDFVATGDSLSFNYIFASYEYSGYTCSPFNDPFGFFLSGAGINGNPSMSTVNLAVVPNTNPPVPVAVNTLNQGSPSGGYPAATCLAANPNYTNSSAFYVSHPNSNFVNATGYTLPLRAKAQVVCGNLYHIKLAVADVSDQALHSMAFLEARSFRVPSVSFSTSTNHNNSFADSMIVEGCNSAYLVVEKAGNVSQPLTVNYSLGGTAIEGVDFDQLPDSIYVAAGVLRDSIAIDFYDDGLNEGVETLEINTQQIVTPCYTYAPQQIVYYVRDRQAINVNVNLLSGTDTLDCPFTPIQLEALTSGGDGQLQGAWWDGRQSQVRWDTLSEDETFYYYSWDECSAESVIDSLTIYVRESVPLVVTADSNWTCQGDSMDVSVHLNGGIEPLNFVWWDGVADTNRRFRPSQTTYYPFSVADICGNMYRDSAVIFVPPPIDASFNLNEDPAVPLGISISNFSQNASEFYWDFGDGDTSSLPQPSHLYSRPRVFTVKLWAWNEYGCVDSTSRQIDIKQDFSLFLPSAFTPNGDGINDHFAIHGGGFESYEIQIYNRWGQLIFRTNKLEKHWDGTFNGEAVPSGVYYYLINLALEDQRRHSERGSIQIYR
jgi:gliding motility-associated-like protein